MPLNFIERKPGKFHCTDGGTEAERESVKWLRKDVCMADTNFSDEFQDGAATAALSFLQLKGNWAVPQCLFLPQHSCATVMSGIKPARDLGSSSCDARLGQPPCRLLACPQAMLALG